MIPLLCFTKNRPAQLDLLLRSVKKHAPIFFPTIIYKADAEYEEGYMKLMGKQYLPCSWKRETNIHDDLVAFLEKTAYNGTGLFCLATDDSVFYRKLDATTRDIIGFMNENTFDNFCVSLRMGQNNTIQDPKTKEPQVKISTFLKERNWMMWNWMTYPPHSNPGYPMGQDGHIFRAKDWIEYIDFPFSNMRTIESEMVNRRWNYTKECMVSPLHSVLVNIAANSVQEPFIDNGLNNISTEELNRRYMSGQIIDLEAIEKVDVNGCHMYINYQFKEDNEIN